jgi:hypothetical protein
MPISTSSQAGLFSDHFVFSSVTPLSFCFSIADLELDQEVESTTSAAKVASLVTSTDFCCNVSN